MMITKAQVELVRKNVQLRTLDLTADETTQALKAIDTLIAVGERLADGTHVLISIKSEPDIVEKAAMAITNEFDHDAWDRILKTSILPNEYQAAAKLEKQRRLARAAINAVIEAAK